MGGIRDGGGDRAREVATITEMQNAMQHISRRHTFRSGTITGSGVKRDENAHDLTTIRRMFAFFYEHSFAYFEPHDQMVRNSKRL